MAVEEFGKAVFTIETTSEAKLRSAMQRNERVIDASTKAMEQDFRKVSVASQQMSGNAASAGQVFGAVGAQAGALGGQVGSLGGQIASLGGAFSGLGKAIFGLPGILLGIGAAIGIIASTMLAARQRAKEFREEIEALIVTQEGLQQTLSQRVFGGEQGLIAARAGEGVIEKTQAAFEMASAARAKETSEITEQTRALKDQIKERAEEIRQLASQRLAIDQRRTMEPPGFVGILGSPAGDPERTRGGAVVDAATQLRQQQLIQIQRQERETISLTERRLSQIAELQEISERKLESTLSDLRDKARRDELDKERQQAAKIGEVRRKALEGVLAKAQATPFGRVFTTALDVIKERREQTDLKNVLGGLKAFFPSIGGLVDEVAQRLGITQPSTTAKTSMFAGGGTSAVALSAFVGSGAGRPGVSVTGDPAEQERRKQERERTESAKTNTRLLESIDRKIGGGAR